MKKFKEYFLMAAVVMMVSAMALPGALAQTGGETAGQPGQERQGRQFGKRMGRRGGHGGPGMSFRGLNLTDGQKEQFKQLNQDYRQRTQSLREELRTKQADLRKLQESESFNEALAVQKLTEMSTLKARMMAENHKHRQQMESILTPEQKTQLEQFKQNRAAKMSERRAKREARGVRKVQ